MLARARTCTCGRVSDTSTYTCRREPWLRCAPTRAGAYWEHLDAVSNLTSRTGELRSAPSWPDDWYRADPRGAHLECSWQPHIQGRGAKKRRMVERKQTDNAREG